MKVVLDTHALMLHTSRVLISVASIGEVSILVAKSHPVGQAGCSATHRCQELGIEETPLDGGLALDSVALSGLRADPADRFIVATVIKSDATLIMPDARLLAWKGPLACIDARV